MRPFRSRPLPGLACLALAGLMLQASPVLAVRLASWNLLNYPNSSGAVREPSYRTVLAAIHPDVLVCQEMDSQAGVTQFKTNVLDQVFPGEYTAGPFIDGPDTDNAIYYRASVVSLVSNANFTTPPTTVRQFSRYQLRFVGYTAPVSDLWLYSFHLKASTGSANEAQRLLECQTIRANGNGLPANSRIIYAGDYNMQDSTEAGYVHLLSSQADNDGRVHDPVNRGGHWNSSVAFAPVHTQSPKNLANPYGGATGGMDDRFDFMLSSTALLSKEGLSYLAGTYKAYGNDGLHCCNAALNDPPTIPEGAAMANALTDASDHLPMIMDVQLPAKVGVVASLSFGTVIVGTGASQPLAVGNVATTPADELNYTLSASAGFTAPAGSFIQNAGFPATNQTISMLTASAGPKNGLLTLASDDPDNPTKSVTLSGQVVGHAVPTILAAGTNTLDSLDFGAHDVGGFADLPAGVRNDGYSSLQAQLNVYGAAVTGPDAARFSIVGGFTPVVLGGAPASWNIHFDDTGAAAGDYAATLTFSNRDDQLVGGATNLGDVVYRLKAKVTTPSGVPTEQAPPALTQLLGNYPNPFNPTTTIAFNLAGPQIVHLGIFDVSGRLVRTLVNGDVAGGRYAILWDGRDEAGQAVGSGVYYYRLDAGLTRQTKSMVMTK